MSLMLPMKLEYLHLTSCQLLLSAKSKHRVHMESAAYKDTNNHLYLGSIDTLETNKAKDVHKPNYRFHLRSIQDSPL